MIGRILYIVTGVILTISVAAAGNYGIDRESVEAYMLAMNMQSELGDMGFEGFDVRNYDVSFYAGNKDYVVHMDSTGNSQKDSLLHTAQNGNLSVVKRKAISARSSSKSPALNIAPSLLSR